MKYLLALLLCLPWPVLAAAQDSQPQQSRSQPRREDAPIVAAHAPIFHPTTIQLRTSFGYTYMNVEMPSARTLSLSGVNSGFIADLSSVFGLVADASYVRTPNVIDTANHADNFSYLAGPELYPVRHQKFRLYVRGLGGGARVSGVNSAEASTGRYGTSGYVNKYSWAVGGGVEYQFTSLVGLRIGGDYQHSYFYDPNSAIRGQHNLRIVCSLVWTLWDQERRH